VALVCIPPLIAALGAPRFGLLTLVWAVVSYFGLFDLGLGRAVTQQLSAALGAGRPREARAIAAHATAMLLLLGVLAGLVLWLVAPRGVALLRDVTDSAEAIRAAGAMAWAMPFVVLTSGLRGAMEAKGAFGAINVIRVTTGALTFVVPLAIVRLGWNDLGAIAWALAALRAVGCALHAGWIARLLPGAFRPWPLEPAVIRRLFAFGGWLTVSNVVGPLMSYLDRFVIGAVLSLSAVAWYVTPQEIVTKLLIVATALTSVMFPRLAELHAAEDADGTARRIERQGLLVLYLVLFPLTLALGAAGDTVLRLWVGAEFAREGGVAMLVFCFGVLLNSLAQVPYAAIQARGRADWTAALHLVELPLFVAGLYLLASQWGVAGAALAWTLRIAVDFAALAWLARPRQATSGAPGRRIGVMAIAALSGAAFGAGLVESPALRAAACALPAVAALALALWLFHGDLPSIVRGRSTRMAR
jgi:O-antigen/teichoic acid export membrane protein